MADFLVDATTRTYAWFVVLVSRGFDLSRQHLKVKNEAIEFADSPCLDELADVYITVIGSLVQHGWSVEQLAVAVDSKMTINEARTWRQTADGTYQHIND